MSAIPAHLQRILSGHVRPVQVAQITPMRDRAPVFTPSQGGCTPRTLSGIIDDAEDLETHDAPECIEGDPDTLALVIAD